MRDFIQNNPQLWNEDIGKWNFSLRQLKDKT
jgi:hypothetical protein